MPNRNAVWHVYVVEDDPTYARQVCELIKNMVHPYGTLSVTVEGDFEKALTEVAARKVDVLVLDVYRGNPREQDDRGLDLLNEVKKAGFVPIVLYTALRESVSAFESPFVAVVGKDEQPQKLQEKVLGYFRMMLPQINRTIGDHVMRALGDYMYTFVQENWDEFRPLLDKPDFIRLLLHRLGEHLSRKGVDDVIRCLYPDAPADAVPLPDPASVHPCEVYIKPPLASHPMLGDLRRSEDGSIWVVLWPTCDMVPRGGTTKVDQVLLARTRGIEQFSEYQAWVSDPENTGKLNNLKRLMKNNRQVPGEQPDRYHFLPGVWDIPDLVIDFLMLKQFSMAEVQAMPCVATIASPYAELIAQRFTRYIGRLGVPDLDVDVVLNRWRRQLRERDG